MTPMEELQTVVYPAMAKLLKSLPQAHVGFGRNREPVVTQARGPELFMVANYTVGNMLGYGGLEIEIKPYKTEDWRGQEYHLEVTETVSKRDSVITFIGAADKLVSSNAADIRRAWDRVAEHIQKSAPKAASLRAQAIRLAAIREALRPHLLAILASEKSAAQHLPIGETRLSRNKDFRIYRSMSSVTVTDLAGAGKRGKTCAEAVLWDIDVRQSPRLADAVDRVCAIAADASSYEDAAAHLRFFVEDASENYPDARRAPQYHERTLKGVDVTPADFSPIKIETGEFSLESDYDDFTIRDKRDRCNLPVCIPAIKGGKSDIKVFYRWVSDNESRIKNMTYSEVLRGMGDAGIRYHSYYSMD